MTPLKMRNEFVKITGFNKLRGNNQPQCWTKGNQLKKVERVLADLGMEPYEDTWAQKHVVTYRVGNVGAWIHVYQGDTMVKFRNLASQPLVHIPYD